MTLTPGHYGIYPGLVVSNADPKGLKRVLLKVPQVLGTAHSNWAPPVLKTSKVPAVHASVFVMFINGDPIHPVYLTTPNVSITSSGNSGDYYVADYGAVADGVTDDTTAIQAAIDDASSHGGGNVHLVRGKTCAWSSTILLKNGVMLTGKGGNGSTVPDMKALTSASMLKVGQYSGSYSPAGLYNLYIEGNRQGPTASNSGLVWFESTEVEFRNVYIHAAAGAGLYCNAAQNSEFSGLHIDDCLRGIVFDNGSGGLNLTRVEFSNNGIGIQFIDTPSMANAYPFGSAQILFSTCISEWYANAHNSLTTLLDMQCGASVKFENCGFSNNSTTPSSAGAQCLISNTPFPTISTNVEFTSCIWNGQSNDAAIRVVGPQQVEVNGLTYAANQSSSGTQYFYLQDTGIAAQVALNFQSFIPVGNITMTGSVNSGSTAQCFKNEYTTEVYNAIDAFHWPLEGKIIGDAGVRWYIDGDGGYHWNTGADYNNKASITYDQTDDLLIHAATRHYFTTPIINAKPGTLFAAGAVTLDTSKYQIYPVAVVGTGSVTSLSFTNPIEGEPLTLIVISDGGGQTFTWPSNIAWPTSTPPSPTAGPAGSYSRAYQFIYDSGSGNWLATSVS